MPMGQYQSRKLFARIDQLQKAINDIQDFHTPPCDCNTTQPCETYRIVKDLKKKLGNF